jgi:hypothetical protein
MAAILVSIDFNPFYGVPTDEQKRAPIENLPVGSRVRFKFSNRAFARCFVKASDGITAYVPEFRDGRWVINSAYAQASNFRTAA